MSYVPGRKPPDALCPDCGGRAGVSLYGEVWCVADCHLKSESKGGTGWVELFCNVKYKFLVHEKWKLYDAGRTCDAFVCVKEKTEGWDVSLWFRERDIRDNGNDEVVGVIPNTFVADGESINIWCEYNKNKKAKDRLEYLSGPWLEEIEKLI